MIGEFRFLPGPAASQTAAEGGSGSSSQAAPRQVDSSAPAPDLAKLHEDLFKLGVRGDTVRNSLQSLQKQIAANGGNLRVDIQRAASLMNGYLESASRALEARDADGARDYMQKAEKQVDILERFFHL